MRFTKFHRCIAALFVLAALMFPGAALAATKVPIVQYYCTLCGKGIWTFRGDNLDTQNWFSEKQFGVGTLDGYLLPKCKETDSWHIFTIRTTKEVLLTTLAGAPELLACLPEGNTLDGVTLSQWRCFMCGMEIYTLNNENPNIRNLLDQPRDVLSLGKNVPLTKCPNHRFGHVFELKFKDMSVKSSNIGYLVNKNQLYVLR